MFKSCQKIFRGFPEDVQMVDAQRVVRGCSEGPQRMLRVCSEDAQGVLR